MKKLFYILLFLFFLGAAHAQFHIPSFSQKVLIPGESSAQNVSRKYATLNSLSGSEVVRIKNLIQKLEDNGIYGKLAKLTIYKFWNGSNKAYNLIVPLDYNGALTDSVKAGVITTVVNGIELSVGDSIDTHWINDIMRNASNVGAFYYTPTAGVDNPIIVSSSPFNMEQRFNGKAYVSIWASALGVSVPVTPSGFFLGQRKSTDTVEFYQGATKYQEVLAINSMNPVNNTTYLRGNSTANFSLYIQGFCEALTETEVSKLKQCLDEYLSDNGGVYYEVTAHSQGPIIKVIKTSDGQFNVGLQGNKSLDDGRGFVIGDTVYNFSGTDNTTTYNQVSVSANKGITWTYNPNAPWSVRNAMGVCVVNGVGKMWAGKGSANYNDSWNYTPSGGWVQVSSAMTGFPTGCQQFAYAWTSASWGSKYLTIGGANQNDIKSSSDLITWTSVLTLPYLIQNTSAMTATVDTINGYLYVAGGKTSITGAFPGKMYKFSLNASGAPALVDSFSATWLQDQWPNMVWCTWGLLYIRGHNGTANQQGVYFCPQGSNPMIASNWQRLITEIPPRHATPFFTNQNYTEAFAVMGNFWNESWYFKKINE